MDAVEGEETTVLTLSIHFRGPQVVPAEITESFRFEPGPLDHVVYATGDARMRRGVPTGEVWDHGSFYAELVRSEALEPGDDLLMALRELASLKGPLDDYRAVHPEDEVWLSITLDARSGHGSFDLCTEASALMAGLGMRTRMVFLG